MITTLLTLSVSIHMGAAVAIPPFSEAAQQPCKPLPAVPDHNLAAALPNMEKIVGVAEEGLDLARKTASISRKPAERDRALDGVRRAWCLAAEAASFARRYLRVRSNGRAQALLDRATKVMGEIGSPERFIASLFDPPTAVPVRPPAEPAASTAPGDRSVSAAGGPRLTFVEPVKDFGTVPKGTRIEWSFDVRNTGSKPLEIRSATPSNRFITVTGLNASIAPGAAGKVSVGVDTAPLAGPIAPHVTIDSNDPHAPQARLTVTAIVKPYVDAYPMGFLRFSVPAGTSQTRFVTLYSEETEPFQIVGVESSVPWITVRHTKAETPIPKVGRAGQHQHRIEVTVGANAPAGPISGRVKVLTNSKHQPEYTIAISGSVK